MSTEISSNSPPQIEWIPERQSKPLHKEIVLIRTNAGIQEAFYHHKQQAWFNTECRKISCAEWRKVTNSVGSVNVIPTRFFHRKYEFYDV